MKKIRAIKVMIGDYFDWDGDTFYYFMDEIEKIESGEEYIRKSKVYNTARKENLKKLRGRN